MALPGDVTTFTLTFGPYTNGQGSAALVGTAGKLFPVDPSTNRRVKVLHPASGAVIVPADVAVTVLDDGTATVAGIPHTGQSSLSPSGWAWRVEWSLPSNNPSHPGNKTFVVVSGATVDYDQLVAADTVPPVAISLPNVTSVAGLTGAPTSAQLVTAMGSDLDAAYATDAALTAGLAGKQDTATLDTAVAAKVDDPASAASVALRAAFVPRGAPNVAAPLLVTTPVTIDKTGTNALTAQDPATGLFYAVSSANGHYMTSPDLVTWTDRTYSPSVYNPGLTAMAFDATYMYSVSATDGKLWRAAKGVFNAWTEITVAAKGPLTTGRPGSLCALGNGVLLFGNYTSGLGDGSHIWRSTDAGATWTEVLTQAGGKHVHCIRLNPATGVVWASLGDQGHQGAGLWKSTDQGLTWTHMSSNDYGIDMVFVPARESRPALVVLEGDGLNRPHLMAFPQDGAAGDDTFPLVWYTGAPGDAASTRGTVRGICLTPNEDILYWVTTESGAVGSKAGLYIAQAPYYTRAVLLADTTGAEPPGYLRGYVSGTVTQQNRWRITTPTFATY